MEKVIAQLRTEIESREQQVATMRAEIARLREAMRIITATSGAIPVPNVHASASSATALLSMTHPAMAQQVLRENGQPMHVGEIVEQIRRKFSRDVARTSLTTILFKYSKNEHLFFKQPNNVYGLLEWQRNGHGTDSASQESRG